jgi:hypothetical protein
MSSLATRTAHRGGCLCGAIRFLAESDPVATGYCHCRLCQRSTGAPVLAWGSFPVASFAYVHGEPRVYGSSPHGQREFCPRCGTQLAYREIRDAATVDVNLGSLDRPETVVPRIHVFTGSRIPWFETADSLPRYEGALPEQPRA